jgi:hypothetical protein
MVRHPGCDRTTEIITRNYDFENFDKHIQAYIDMCDICARFKLDYHKSYS